jgi:hypothetical protein
MASLREKQLLAFPLKVLFPAIMSAELNLGPQRALAEHDLLLGRADSAFHKSVQIRLLAGGGMLFTLPALRTDRNDGQNFASRSCRT